MTLNEFIAKYQNRKVDWDGAYGAQCVDLYRFYVHEVWGLTQTPKVIGAYQIFDTLQSDIYNKNKKSVGEVPQAGDVITWNENYAKNGHIGIVVSTEPGLMRVFEQNNPVGSGCVIGVHNYNNVIGWFRPIIKPMPITIRIKLVANHIEWPSLQERLNRIADWHRVYSNNRLNLAFDVEHTNFTNIPFQDYDLLEPTFSWGAEKNWQLQNILPKAIGYDVVILAMSDQDWDTSRHFATEGVMLGELAVAPSPMVINLRSDEFDFIRGATFASFFEYICCHELSHVLLGLTGQDFFNGENITHKRFYSLGYADAPLIFGDINYLALSNVLAVRRELGVEPMKFYKVNQAGKWGVLILQGLVGTLLFENDFAQYNTLLKITNATYLGTINIPAGKFFRIQDGSKSGILVVEGFSGTVLFENNWTEYLTLLQISGLTITSPLVTIPV